MTDNLEDLPADAIRVEEVARLLGKSVPAVWDNLNKVPGFPQPRRIVLPGQGRATYWLREEVECFFADQVDKAWRGLKQPHPAILDWTLLDKARRAMYVLRLFCIPPQEVPGGLGYTDADNARLFDFAQEVVDGLERNKSPGPINSRGYPLDMEVARYHKTLAHCSRVLKYRANPEDNGWFENRAGYRRGIYLRFGTTSGRKPWQEPQS